MNLHALQVGKATSFSEFGGLFAKRTLILELSPSVLPPRVQIRFPCVVFMLPAAGCGCESVSHLLLSQRYSFTLRGQNKEHTSIRKEELRSKILKRGPRGFAHVDERSNRAARLVGQNQM